MLEEYKTHLLRQGFELKEGLGKGLSGHTYKGYQKSLNRYVAIKFFDNKLQENNITLRKQFLREANLLAEAQHLSIPYVITKGEVKKGNTLIPYIVMQFIPGITLDLFHKSKSRQFEVVNTRDEIKA